MWAQVVDEKRTGFDELVRAENMADYVVALIFGPLMAVLAFKARTPVVAAGFGIIALTMVALASIMLIVYRSEVPEHDLSLREHLERLLAGYAQRLRFLQLGTALVAIALSVGVILIMSGSSIAIRVALCLLPFFWLGQWIMLRRRTRVLAKKRQQAEQILNDLSKCSEV